MKIKVTIEELEPKHISLVASLITELHRAGIEVDVPEEQEDTQETQEDHAEKIRKAEVATKEDVENLFEDRLRSQAPSRLRTPRGDSEHPRQTKRSAAARGAKHRAPQQETKTLLRNFAGMGNGRASSRPDEAPTQKLERLVQEQLENIIEHIEAGPESMREASADFALMACGPAHIETDAKSLVEESLLKEPSRRRLGLPILRNLPRPCYHRSRAAEDNGRPCYREGGVGNLRSRSLPHLERVGDVGKRLCNDGARPRSCREVFRESNVSLAVGTVRR